MNDRAPARDVSLRIQPGGRNELELMSHTAAYQAGKIVRDTTRCEFSLCLLIEGNRSFLLFATGVNGTFLILEPGTV